MKFKRRVAALAAAIALTSGVGAITTNINQNNGNGVVKAKSRKVWNTGIHFFKRTNYKAIYSGGVPTYHFETKYNKQKKLVSIKRVDDWDEYSFITQYANFDGYRYYHGKKYYVIDGPDKGHMYKNSACKKYYRQNPQAYDRPKSFVLASDLAKSKNIKPIVYTAKKFIPVYWPDHDHGVNTDPDTYTGLNRDPETYIGKNRTFLLMQSTGMFDKSFKQYGEIYVAAAVNNADTWEKDKFGYWWIDETTDTKKQIDPDEYLYPDEFDDKVEKKMKAIDLESEIMWDSNGHATYIKKSDLDTKAVKGGHFEAENLDLSN